MIQLFNAIQLAFFYNYNVILPKHTYFTTTYIVINKKIKEENKTLTHYDNFYNIRINSKYKKQFYKYIEKTISILKNIFTIKNISPLNVNDAVIHMRGGDIFKKKKPHGRYIMPPLSYYVNIINNNNFDKIFIISEDKQNPCINKLLELYENVEFKGKSLEDDIRLLLGSKTVIESFGTFTPYVLLVSNNITNIYRPSYQFPSLLSKCSLKKINVFKINLEEYRKKIFPWENTKEQNNMMLTY